MTTTTASLENATQRIIDMLIKESAKRRIPPCDLADATPAILRDIGGGYSAPGRRTRQQ
jgi:hypothetical protein